MTTKRRGRRSRPTLELRPGSLVQGDLLQIAGAGWPLDAIVVTIGTKERKPDRIVAGSWWDASLVPRPDGSFLIELATQGLKPGAVVIRAAARGGNAAAEAKLEVRERVRWSPKVPRAKLDKPAMRGLAFKRERVPGGRWPKGFTLAMRRDWIDKFVVPRRDIGRDDLPHIFFTAPIPGSCNWVPLGPAPFVHGRGSPGGNNTGRTRCLAIDPVSPWRMYAGTAAAGVWKSLDSGATWAPKTDDKFSLAIGALAIDPVTPSIVYAGTGEYVPGSDYGVYYGRGLLRSDDFGDTWAEMGIVEFDLAEIARIVIDPANTANLFVAASNGIWQSVNSGTSWTQLTADACTDLVLVRDPAQAGTRRLIAGFAFGEVHQSVDNGSGWGSFTTISVPGAPAASGRIVFGVCRTQANTMYAAFCEQGGINFKHVARSDDWGQTWAARNIPATGPLWAANYCMAIQPHPTMPDTVLLGVVGVFMSTDGGSTWTIITNAGIGPVGNAGVHADVHSITWDPFDANRVFVTCDGGVFTTPDGGATWQARNLDISALQFYDLGQHPVYEAILIGGSQDNGGFHYSGAPIWKRTWVAPELNPDKMGGDGVIAQIDPFDGYIHYYGTGPEASASRSDDAGKTFGAAPWSFFPGSEWDAPFYCDPSTAGVLVTGGTRVWRSDARGDAGTWLEITGDLAEPLRSIGFDPSNPRVLYAGTIGGHVYRLTGPMAGAWTAATVTNDDVTYTGLPAGMGISSIAVDSSGNVWVTSSNLLETMATGEFTNDHVFRLDAGAMAWVSRSNGLAVANPINTIVIDPADSTRVFCGGDRGVYAWDAAAQTWNAFDQGLANAPVWKLAIHAPSRKLRAATYGRGVWERSLDNVDCTDHFLYLRDNLVDSGRTPSPDNVPHPYIAGELCHRWQSPDIVVDPFAQTTSLVTSPIEIYDGVANLGAKRGANRVYVLVNNKGPFAVTSVAVRVFFAPASMGLPPFPMGLLNDPFTWNPPGSTSWTPIAPAAFMIARIEPGTTRLASWDFVIPASAPEHSCLMAFVTSAEDPFAAAGIANPDQLVVQNRKVALRNLDLDAIPGSASATGDGIGSTPLPPGTVARELKMHGAGWARAVILCANMPEDAVLIAAIDRRSRKKLRVAGWKSTGRSRAARDLLAKLREGAWRAYDIDKAVFHEAKPGARIVIGEVRLDPDHPATLFVALHSAKWDRAQTYSFDAVQMAGERIVGGYTLQIADLERMQAM